MLSRPHLRLSPVIFSIPATPRQAFPDHRPRAPPPPPQQDQLQVTFSGKLLPPGPTPTALLGATLAPYISVFLQISSTPTNIIIILCLKMPMPRPRPRPRAPGPPRVWPRNLHVEEPSGWPSAYRVLKATVPCVSHFSSSFCSFLSSPTGRHVPEGGYGAGTGAGPGRLCPRALHRAWLGAGAQAVLNEALLGMARLRARSCQREPEITCWEGFARGL